MWEEIELLHSVWNVQTLRRMQGINSKFFLQFRVVPTVYIELNGLYHIFAMAGTVTIFDTSLPNLVSNNNLAMLLFLQQEKVLAISRKKYDTILILLTSQTVDWRQTASLFGCVYQLRVTFC